MRRLIAWDNLRPGMGKRSRRRGDYLAILQKPPINPSTWTDNGIPSRWVERIVHPRSQHAHKKPIGLISQLIRALSKPGDLIVDPAAGSFVVMRAAYWLKREFIGCDIAYSEGRDSP
jgi:site-specific DNA-methyltransferase (adenine-specific)